VSIYSIASSDTVSIMGALSVEISGTTTINTISGVKDGQILTIYPTGTWAFGASGNIVATATAMVSGSVVELLCRNGTLVQLGVIGASGKILPGTINGTTGSGSVVLASNLTLTAGTFTVVTNGAVRRVVSRFDWTNAMVTALGAGTAGNVAICTLPAKTILMNAYSVIGTAAGGVATLTVSVGRVAANYDDYLVASDAKAAANTVYGDALAERGTNLTGYDIPSFTGTTLVNARFISTGGNLNAVTTSTGSVYLMTEQLS